MTLFGESKGAFGRINRSTCCLKITVTASSADIFIKHLLMYPFGDSFNYFVKLSTKHIPIRPTFFSILKADNVFVCLLCTPGPFEILQ